MSFSFKIYSLVAAGLIGSVGSINWLIDPLWYSHGNQITDKNFTFNERISKTNLLLRTKDERDYNCLILGSSRVIALKASMFKDKRCFNYSFKGGWVDDFIAYAKFAKEQGIDPDIVYVGVDSFNFVKETKFNEHGVEASASATNSMFEAYFSLDVLTFSAMTLAEVSPDPTNYYNQNFEIEEFENPPKYNPEFYPPLSPQECDLSRIEPFQKIRDIFPNAKFVGYVPPRSAWAVVMESYDRELMDCELEGIYKVSQIYDEMYDFSIPSPLTKDPNNTYDGSHFTPEVNDQVAEVMQGKGDDSFGIQVNQYSLSEYKTIYKGQIKKFLDEQNQLQRWKE
ncbi:hypothetical protein [Lyngbya sp. CCY1209]|uniref:hypothetical protein n=1 Tax=Lyngbya sp. CCY1209 TaxID=2886103 RepID=UPI002D1FEA88|nr:hypothetical protein [Lyngbya sp. CCY1209]MEB3885682.1 hypothetical protein [Lyngbya sp. CCY1209]